MIKNISIIPTIIERRNAINFALDKNLIFSPRMFSKK